ncbi:unnamed protein product [Symbiodinium natans]|uniref:Phytanoyl-CoA dioxygenase n=1 Tax=Symbiodinium natans TaxID=878477 RepID=A0A812G1F6_9DINO|nr:unnamed protein product [Symbiodinium natans]
MACLSCLEGLRLFVPGHEFSGEAGAPAESVEAQKARRREGWVAAQLAAKTFLRQWMAEHPGEEVPEDVYRACQEALKSHLPEPWRRKQESDRCGERKDAELRSFVRHSHLELLRQEGPPQRLRSPAEWEALFPRYPSESPDGHGFLKSFEASDSEGISQALEKYGFCVVKALSKEQCEASVVAMFEEINALRVQKGIEGPPVAVEDDSTWFDRNWPSSCKFLVDDVALHRQAFANRCSANVYQAFRGIWGESRLHVSVDKWGVARGAKDRPRWRVGLKPHWDVNPWQCLRDLEAGVDPGYQGLIALRDQDLETGCHLTLPGCRHFLKQWCLERPLSKVSGSAKSFRASEEDPILRYMQPVPLRQGEMVIWSCAQLHGSTHNLSSKMRLAQYVRMFPAPSAACKANYDEKDSFSCTRVLRKCLRKGQLKWRDIEDLNLDGLGRQLLGVDLL